MDAEVIFGKERLASYTSIYEHNRNLKLIGRITPRLAAIELSLRNLLDHFKSEHNKAWINASELDEIRVKINPKGQALESPLSAVNT